VFITPFSEDTLSGHAFAAVQIEEIVPGRVYALSGFGPAGFRSSRVLIRQSSLPGEPAWAEISTSRRERAFHLGCAQCYGQIRPACIRIYEILGTRLTSNSLRGFVLDTQMLLRPVLSSFVAFTAMSAFIGLPRRVLSFALQATWSGAQKSKCRSSRGKATVRPRCQGRRVVAFIGAKRRPFTAGGIRRRVWPGRADLPLTESLARKV